MTDNDPDPTDAPDPKAPLGRPSEEPPLAGAAQVPLSAPLPAGLPGTVAAFLAAQAIVTRGQAAVCLACLKVEPELLAGVRLDPDDIRRALEVLQIDVLSAFTLMQAQIKARFAVPPPGVPLDAPPGTLPGERMEPAGAPGSFGRRDLGDLFGPDVVPIAEDEKANDAITVAMDEASDEASASSSHAAGPDKEPRP